MKAKTGVFMALIRALSGKRGPSGKSAWSLIAAAPGMLWAKLRGRNSELPTSRFVLILLGLAYVVSPFDFVLNPILATPIDDAFVVAWLSSVLLEEADAYVLRQETRAGQTAPDDYITGTVL